MMMVGRRATSRAPSPLFPQVRFKHDPDSADGFTGAALSSNLIHIFKDGDKWDAKVRPLTGPRRLWALAPSTPESSTGRRRGN